MEIRKYTLELLQQIENIVGMLKTNELSMPLDVLHGNSIGNHVRHMIEFFECLDQAYLSLKVNYDNRKRNPMLETNPEYIFERIEQLKHSISLYEEKSLFIEVDYGSGKQEIYSSLLRELIYNIEHCVHHLAIIKIGLASNFPLLKIDQNLGVAYSTQQYLKTN